MKRWRNVIILGITIVLLLGAYFALKARDSAAEPESSGESGNNPEEVKLLDYERDDINRIVMKYGGEEIVLVLEERQVEVETQEEDGTTSTTTRTDKVWVCDSFEPDQAVVSDVIYGGVNARTKRMIDSDPQDLSIYGLDNPVRVTFFSKDGGSQTIEVGNPTPTGDYYYVKKGSGKEVYTLARYLAEYLAPDRYSLVSKRLYHADDLSVEDMTEMTFYRDGELVFSAHLKDSSSVDWLITEPLEVSANLQNLNRFLNGLSGLKAARIVGEVSSLDLDEYGLGEPRYVFRYTLDGRSYELIIGNRDGSYYYAMMEGNDYVFTISSDKVSYLDLPLTDIAQMMVYVPAIYNTSKLVIEIDGRTDVLEMDVSQERSENDVYIFNGQKIEDEDDQGLFRKYYQGAIAISGDRIDLDASPEGEAEVRLTYTSKGGEVTVVELIPTPDGYGYYAMKNGKYTGLVVPRRELDKEDMGIRKAYEDLMEGLKD